MASNNEKGFTFIELLLAITLLTLSSVAFMPILTMSMNVYEFNRARTVAHDLAAARIDEIKALPYEVRYKDTSKKGQIKPTDAQVGILNGNPPGQLEPTISRNINGIDYTIQTRIYWFQENPGGTDSKKVTVTVKAVSPLSGKTRTLSYLETLVSKEGEKTLVESGNLLVSVQKDNEPSASIPITIQKYNTSGQLIAGSEQNAHTDTDGAVLFGELAVETDYDVRLSTSSDFVLEPTDVNSTSLPTEWKGNLKKEVIKWKDTPVYLNIHYPITLNLSFEDEDGNPLPEITTTDSVGVDKLWVSLRRIPGLEYTKTDDTDIKDDPMEVIRKATQLSTLKIWPLYQYDLKIGQANSDSNPSGWSTSNNEFILRLNSSQWDGSFPIPSEPTEISRTLVVKAAIPVCTSVVTSTGAPVESGVGITKNSPVTVTLSSATSGTIYYYAGTGSSAPNTLYTGPFTLPGQSNKTYNIRVKKKKESADEAMLDSDTWTCFVIKWNS